MDVIVVADVAVVEEDEDKDDEFNRAVLTTSFRGLSGGRSTGNTPCE